MLMHNAARSSSAVAGSRCTSLTVIHKKPSECYEEAGERCMDHPRDHPGKCLYYYYAGTFWLYLHSHCRLRNVTLVCVLCACNGDLTMALV